MEEHIPKCGTSLVLTKGGEDITGCHAGGWGAGVSWATPKPSRFAFCFSYFIFLGHVDLKAKLIVMCTLCTCATSPIRNTKTVKYIRS